MRVRQIFFEYPAADDRDTDHWKYCPECGAKLTIKEAGGRDRSACEKCGFIHYRNPSPAVAVLIAYNGSVLLGKRAPGSFQAGKWCLPCGFIEYDEDFLLAAKRETLEETGLEIEIEGILSVMSNFFMPELHSLVIVLLAGVAGGTLQPGDDITEVKWVPLQGPFPLMAFAADRHIIAYYNLTRSNGLPVQKI